MNRTLLASLAAVLLAGAATFWLFERQISSAWLRLGLHPEVLATLERSLDDQKRLSRLDPAHEAEYRKSFDDGRRLLNRLRILEHNREQIGARYRAILLGLVGAVLFAAGVAHWLGRSRHDRRLERLREALVALSSGREDLAVDDRRRHDLLGKIAGMIEEISRGVSQDRKRLASLANLSLWQEGARRQAHELRTPLAAAQLTLARLQELPLAEEARRGVESVAEDFDRLARFAREFTSFARLPEPRLVPVDLYELGREFTETFARAWPNLSLAVATEADAGAAAGGSGSGSGPRALADRDMLRQVLVNLLDNSARALSGRAGTARLAPSRNGSRVYLDVADDGPGLPTTVAGRVFTPYVTTKKPGEGMGLGLAIAKKILLDHGGDLQVLADSASGVTFRLSLPAPAGNEEGGEEA